ncbi:hypothetical protein EON80_25130, partial [bacterium]
MPRIDLVVSERREGNAIAQARAEAQALNRELAGGGKSGVGAAAAGAQSQGAASRVTAQLQLEAAQTGAAFGQMGQAGSRAVDNIGGSISKTTRELATLRSQLAETEKHAARVGGKPGASITEGAVVPLKAQIAALEANLASSRASSSSMAQVMAQGGAVPASGMGTGSPRQEMLDNRRQNFDQLMGGQILQQAGEKIEGVLGRSLDEFGTLQMAEIGVKSLEGNNAQNVIDQAREAGKNTYGVTYKDILELQNRLVIQGTERGEAQSLVKGIGDINAVTTGSPAVLQRILYNLTQVKSQDRLTGMDNRQFEMAGLNLRGYYAKYLGVDEKEVRGKISDGEVSADMVVKAILELANDPRFKDRGKIISDTTIPGMQEKNAASWARVGELAGESLAPAFGKLRDWIKSRARKDSDEGRFVDAIEELRV